VSWAEKTLYTLLSDTESVEYLAREHFYSDETLAVVPDAHGKKIVAWSVDQFFRSGRRRAPSREAIADVWEDALEASGIDLGDGTETDDITIVVDRLRAQYVGWRSNELLKDGATAIAAADPTEKTAAVREHTGEWYKLLRSVEPRYRSQDGLQGVEDALQRYFARQESEEITYGMTFGLPPLDEHLHGVHPGEICVVAAETGVGKSWVAVRTLWQEFRRGRTAVLFTLENDLPMTFDRVICMGAKVNYERWQQGQATEAEETRVAKLMAKVEQSEHRFHVEMPGRGERTISAMARKALSLGAQTFILDQLTFVETEGRHQKTSDAILEVMHDLKELVSEGAEKISTLVLHQINREGADQVRKTGVYQARNMAYGSEVERTADFLIAIYQSEMDARTEDAQFQLIKSRRTKRARWASSFRVGDGDVRISHRIVEDHEGGTPPEPERPARGPQPVEEAA
jgi:KaiC/GvpD/RAD55 family RecA-like ATPase